MASGGLVLAGTLPAVLLKEPGEEDEAACWEAGAATLTKVRLPAPEERAGEPAGLAKAPGAALSQRRRASCVPSLSCTRPAYPAAPQRYLKSNVVCITCISAYVAAARRGEIATPLRRRGERGAGHEHASVSGARRWESAPVNKTGRGGRTSVRLPKELLS